MRGKDLTTGSRLFLLLAVYDRVVDDVPACCTYQDVAVRFDVDRSLVSKLWKAHREYVFDSSASGPIDIDALADRLQTKHTGHSGCNAPDIKAIQATVAALPLDHPKHWLAR